MPHQTPCPNCQKTGLVRFEHVIKGGLVGKEFYCGGCEHQWATVDPRPPAPPVPPLPKPRTKTYGPKRRA